MSTFRYKAQAEDGSYISGSIEAGSSSLAAFQLEDQGYTPVSIFEKKGLSFSDLNLVFTRVKSEDLIFFTRQLFTTIKSGIPLLSGLEAIGEQTDNKRLKEVIAVVHSDVDQGSRLSDALSRHPGVFSKIYTNMIYSAEVSGRLQDVLERVILMLEFNRKTMDDLKTAMRYPLMVITAICTAFSFLVTFVIPKFSLVFKGSKMQLPYPTRVMLSINYIVQNYWFYVLGGIALGVIFLFLYIRTESGRLAWHRTKIKIPILGPVLLKIYMSRFCNIFETLTRSGVPIVNALETLSEAIGNEYIGIKIREIAEKVSEGRKLADTFRESQVFPPLVVHMISTGEEAGALDEMLEKVATFYEDAVDNSVDNLSALMEPIIMSVLGVLVGGLMIAMYLPIFMLGAVV